MILALVYIARQRQERLSQKGSRSEDDPWEIIPVMFIEAPPQDVKPDFLQWIETFLFGKTPEERLVNEVFGLVGGIRFGFFGRSVSEAKRQLFRVRSEQLRKVYKSFVEELWGVSPKESLPTISEWYRDVSALATRTRQLIGRPGALPESLEQIMSSVGGELDIVDLVVSSGLYREYVREILLFGPGSVESRPLEHLIRYWELYKVLVPPF